MQKNSNPLLQVRNLKVNFTNPEGTILAVDGISYDLMPGKVLSIVGESGSGKSVNVLTMTHLIDTAGMHTSGEVLFEGKDLISMSENEINLLRGPEIGFVFQNPLSSLNPLMKVGPQIAEGPIHHGIISKAGAKEYVIDLLNKVGIKNAAHRYHDYPHQFSGGMRQRVMIAIALACRPKLLICDEPTTALDVTVERQILDLLMELKASLGIAIILITHNLTLAMNYADEVAVMFAGQIMEKGSSYHIMSNPKHPYTRGLFAANLEIGRKDSYLDTSREEDGELKGLPQGSLVIPHGEEIRDRGHMLEVEGEPQHLYNELYLYAQTKNRTTGVDEAISKDIDA